MPLLHIQPKHIHMFLFLPHSTPSIAHKNITPQSSLGKKQRHLLPMESSSSSSIIFFFSSLLLISMSPQLEASKHSIPRITVIGVVYCDACSNNSFSSNSYFLPGAEVRIDCKFKAASPRTAEQISFSVNRTTDRYGVYKLDIPSVDGINCAREAAVLNTCRASLIRSTSPLCNVPGSVSTSNEFSVKYKQANLCIYSLYALSFRPSKKDLAICGK